MRAASAAGLVALTLGSDGGGSSRLPPAYTGVVGRHAPDGWVGATG
ncbi:amidase family protein [Sinomonas sp. P47F7]